jgi:hypothetical protein
MTVVVAAAAVVVLVVAAAAALLALVSCLHTTDTPACKEARVMVEVGR